MSNRSTAVVLSVLSVALARAGFAQDVKYEKYKLDNGMTVILHEDHTLPVGAINTWYRVGAKDEPPGRSGFAHLFEHLMFMGTKRVPGNDFDNIMESGGGANNASTDFDRTNYFSAGPAALIPTLLWLDADRLEDLGHAMDADKLNKQRDIVRNEIRQQVENRPYGKIEEFVYRLMYPVGHPYHNAVYGTHEDLEAAQVTNVTDFFATYYVPSNAALVVAGDFDSAKVKPLIKDLFGSIPRGAEVQHHTAAPVKLDHVIRNVSIDKVQLPKVMFVYHSPAAFADGDAEMDLLASVLSSGKTSRLFKRMVFDDKIAVEVNASQQSAGLGSLFVIDVLANPDADLDKIEKTIDEEIARLLKDGITTEELEQRKATFELAKLSRLQSVEAKADALNQYEYVWGEPNSFKRDLDRYRNATPAALQSWAKKVLTPDARCICRVLPESRPEIASARDKRPTDFAPAPFKVPPSESFKLSSGIPVILFRRDELPLVSIEMLLKPSGGGALDEPSRAGVTELAATMTSEGTKSLDSLAFGDAMQSLGASFHASASPESVGVSLTVLKRNLDKAAGLMADAIASPRMDPRDWDRVKRLHLEELRQSDDEPPVVASRVGARVLFGDTNPYGWPMAGTPKTVEKLTLDDIKAQHAAIFRPEFASIAIAGNITQPEAKEILEKRFSGWKATGAALKPSTDLSIPQTDTMRFVIVDRPEAVQTVIRFLAPSVKFTDPQRPMDRLLNTILGGSFTSRLNQNLREQHGYTYGARSSFAMQPSIGWFSAGASVRTDVTGASLKEFIKEFGRIRGAAGAPGDVTDAEMVKAFETVRTDIVQSFQGLNGLTTAATDLMENNLTMDAIAKEIAAMQAAKAADLNKNARGAIALERGVLIMVGDKKAILEQIKDIDLPKPVELDAHGNPVVVK